MAVCKTIQNVYFDWFHGLQSTLNYIIAISRGTEKANQYVYLYENKYLLGQQKINFHFLNKSFDIQIFYDQQTTSTSLSSVSCGHFSLKRHHQF